MPDRSIIPRDIKGFNIYIAKTNALLIKGAPENYTRYNWTTDNLTDWQGFESDWVPLKLQYDDEKGQRTSAITEQLYLIIEDAIAYDKVNKLIRHIKATVGLTAIDCQTFHIPLSLASATGAKHSSSGTTTTQTNKTAATTEGVFPKLLPAVGGMVRCKCFAENTSSGKPRKLDDYDLVEYACGVFYSGTENLLTDADDIRLTIKHSSKASFVLQTAVMLNNLPVLAPGVVAPAKILVIFFRWAKSKHPTLNGPWCGAFTTVLL